MLAFSVLFFFFRLGGVFFFFEGSFCAKKNTPTIKKKGEDFFAKQISASRREIREFCSLAPPPFITLVVSTSTNVSKTLYHILFLSPVLSRFWHSKSMVSTVEKDCNENRALFVQSLFVVYLVLSITLFLRDMLSHILSSRPHTRKSDNLRSWLNAALNKPAL